MKYRQYTLKNYNKIAQLKFLPDSAIAAINVVARVLPFKTNNYVVEELIDWNNYESDPLFTINFPQKEFLEPEHFRLITETLESGADNLTIGKVVNGIRMGLNPHPAGQLDYNIPEMEGHKANGIQHKYKETMLIFPAPGQTCHAHCTFCFRWPQFIGINHYKMALKDPELGVAYLKRHPEITDILLTGGDPMVMSADRLETYVDALLESGCTNLRTIRIGTKSLTFWPYRYLTDNDSAKILELFRRIVDSGINLSVMAHINHYREMATDAFREAVKRIQQTGAVIRTQSPILNHVNKSSDVWKKMWEEQVNLGMIPYYMFIPRNTGFHKFFSIPLIEAYTIFKKAFQQVSGLGRTVRGPIMSALHGKIEVNGVTEINNKKYISMSFIQARVSDSVKKPFFAEYDEKSCWINELTPAFGEKQFFFDNAEFRSLSLK